jgi:hypothetical protein
MALMTLSIVGLGARQLFVYANLLRRENCKVIDYMHVMSGFVVTWISLALEVQVDLHDVHGLK